MKPILAISPGNPKSGTTSLFFSLSHSGFASYALFKEPQYWRRILRPNEKLIKYNYDTGERYEADWDWKGQGFKSHDFYLKHISWRIKDYSLNPKPWLSVEDYADLVGRIACNLPTWEDYRLLYLSTSHDKIVRKRAKNNKSVISSIEIENAMKKTRFGRRFFSQKPVMDFSLMNGVLTSEELDIVKSELDEHFDIRVIICLRDYDSWLRSCKKNFIGVTGGVLRYKDLVKKFSSKWPTMIVKMDDLDNKDSVLSTTLNEFLGTNIPKSWEVGKFNITSPTLEVVNGFGDDWDVPYKENKQYYETVKTGIV